MIHSNLFMCFRASFLLLMNIQILSMVLQARKSISVDFHYESCSVPTTCGSQIIKFPFYIRGQQEPYCGYPEFELSCKNNTTPILTFPGENEFIVHEIFYQNHSLLVSNPAPLAKGDGDCIPPIKNTTIPSRFQVAVNYTDLFLFFGCNLSGDTNLGWHRVICNEKNVNDSVVALFEGYTAEFAIGPLIRDARQRCKEMATIPVDNVGANVYGMLSRGFVMEWVQNNCSICEDSSGRCGFDNSTAQFMCFCSDRPHALFCTSPGDAGRGRGFIIKVAAAIGAAGIAGLICLIFYFRKKFSTENGIFSALMKRKDSGNIEAFLRDNRCLALKRYSFKDVEKMTDKYRDKLGEGGFGAVYKGKLFDGCQVAVKVLNNTKDNGQAFMNEVASISRTSHVNIITLLGFCFEGHKRALIYEFVSNGSLEKFIHQENPSNPDRQLKLETLYQIAVGIARGLEYLHRGCNTRILHFDIKPHNILLDDDFCPKISDFGLAKLCPRKESMVSMTNAGGTIGYVAPEVFCRNIGRVSYKSDVYSYGMMVIEMVGERKNIHAKADHSSEYFPQWIYRHLELDEELGIWSITNNDDIERARKMIIVGLWCIQTDPSNRPTISRVVEMLQGSLDSLEIPPKPYLSSPPRSPPQANADSSSSLIV